MFILWVRALTFHREATAYFQEEAGLFVPERSPESSSNKRPYQATVESDIDEEEAEFLRKQGGTYVLEILLWCLHADGICFQRERISE